MRRHLGVRHVRAERFLRAGHDRARRRPWPPARAAVLLPIRSMASGEGPMNVSPASRARRWRTRRSRPGSRSRDARRRRPTPGRRRRACRCAGSSRAGRSRRWRTPRRRSGRAGPCGRTRSRPPPCAGPSRGRPG
ncbi:MAG: hypothetical protein MZV64_13695 [Ignavibacteriales bacterium]|nr:hypothetical protein [Ignavibacteriales bacterium]